MRELMVRSALIVLAFGARGLGGCASLWQQHYRPAGQLRGVELPRTVERARVLEVEWERLSEYAAKARERAIERDTPADRLSESVLRQQFGEMLRVLRIEAPVDDAVLIGTSRFVTTQVLWPTEVDLPEFAARVGGNVVVFSIQPNGPQDTIQYVTRSAWYEDEVYYRTRSGKKRSRTELREFEERVPVVVQRETWLYTAFVFRVGEPGEIALLTRGRPWID